MKNLYSSNKIVISLQCDAMLAQYMMWSCVRSSFCLFVRLT